MSRRLTRFCGGRVVRGIKEGLMTVIEIELPEETAAAARAAGLLTPAALESLLKEAIRRQAGERLLELAREVQAAGVEPMTMEEINEEVKAYRRERRAREAALGAGDAGGC